MLSTCVNCLVKGCVFLNNLNVGCKKAMDGAHPKLCVGLEPDTSPLAQLCIPCYVALNQPYRNPTETTAETTAETTHKRQQHEWQKQDINSSDFRLVQNQPVSPF